MSNPAVEAAQRAWDAIDQDATWDPELDPECAELVAAADEALKPIREKCDQLRERYMGRCGVMSPGIRRALDELAPLIYTKEEL